MLSRIFWVLMVVIALFAGAAMQGNLFFGWGDDERANEKAVEERVERAVEGRVARMEVVGKDGRTIHVSRETKEQLAQAVKRLVSAEAALALAKITDEGEPALAQAQARRDSARAEVERLKAEIDREENLSRAERDAVRDQIREDVRRSVREAVRG